MHKVPQRVSLIDQTVAILRERLAQGEWKGHLPGEIALAAQLHVGRNTIRAALGLLESERVLRTINGQRRQIVAPRHPKAGSRLRAVVLIPKMEDELPLTSVKCFNLLRAQLESRGWMFQVLVEPRAYRRAPEPLLKSLTAGQPNTVWLLTYSTLAMQRWFQAHVRHTVIVGGRYEDVWLPRVGTDQVGLGRHAAGLLLARGHRYLAILHADRRLAVDVQCAAGFRAAAERIEVVEVCGYNNPVGVVTALRGLLRSERVPTGLFVLYAQQCVTALTFLQQQGVAVPGRMSLICRDDEPYPFLPLLWPEPAHYQRDARAVAAALAKMIARCVKVPDLRGTEHLIVPRFIAGATLAPAPVP